MNKQEIEIQRLSGFGGFCPNFPRCQNNPSFFSAAGGHWVSLKDQDKACKEEC